MYAVEVTLSPPHDSMLPLSDDLPDLTCRLMHSSGSPPLAHLTVRIRPPHLFVMAFVEAAGLSEAEYVAWELGRMWLSTGPLPGWELTRCQGSLPLAVWAARIGHLWSDA
jgi:hypothetical protein